MLAKTSIAAFGLKGALGEARMVAPASAKAAVRTCATPMMRMVERTRVRMIPRSPAPSAMPSRNRTRMIVNT